MVARFIPEDGTEALTGSPTISLPQGTAENVSNQAPDRASNPVEPTNTGSRNPKLPSLVANPMEVFTSHNILWTLACLTAEQFNNPPSYRNSPGDLKNIVFASAGRFNDQRQNIFISSSVGAQAPEYYINNFVMKNVIGANEDTGNSNAVKFEFDIVEPHSMGLLLQSMQSAAINAKYLSYLDNAPFVLRMDIQGFDELGRIISNIKPKFFVLKLVGVKFSVNEGGSTYKVDAVPYNHQGFSSAINTTYSDVKLFADGRGHVFDILARNGEGSLVNFLNNIEEKLKQDKEIQDDNRVITQSELDSLKKQGWMSMNEFIQTGEPFDDKISDPVSYTIDGKEVVLIKKKK